MRQHPLTVVIAAAIAVAVGGALFDFRPALAIGGLVALLILAGHPLVSGSPSASRRLLRAGLAGLAAAVVVTVSHRPVDDPRNLWQQPLIVAVLQLAACVCFGIALARAPRARLRAQRPAVPAVVGLLALASAASNEAQTAWDNRPLNDPHVGVLIAVRPAPVLDIHWALTIGILLIGATMTVLGVAQLSRRDAP